MNVLKSLLSLILPATLFVGISYSQTQIIYSTPGPGVFTVPCGVTSITVEVYGGGGGGGGSNTTARAGDGGGAGGYSGATYNFLVPGQTFNYDVGAGGLGGIPTNSGSTGQASNFNGSLISTGGTGGGRGTDPAAPGVGGNGIPFSCPNCATGTNGIAGGLLIGGNGGFVPAPAPNGGSLGPGGGPGAPGGPGGNYGGGGGGGGKRQSGQSTNGGNGGPGAVIINYTSTVTEPNAGPNISTCNAIFMAANSPDAGWTGTWSIVSFTGAPPVIGNVNDPLTSVTLLNGDCAVLRWTFSSGPPCIDLFDDVQVCNPAICNDDPCGAEPLPVNVGACVPIAYPNNLATTSTGMVEPGCGTWTGADVWYSAVVPASGIISFTATDAPGGPALIMGMAIYEGPSCASLFHQGCDFATAAADVAQMTYTGTPGSTVYVRMWTTNGTQGNANICATTPSAAMGDIMPGPNVVTCGTPMIFYDPGGSTGNYANNTGVQYVLCPDTPGQYVTIDFSSGTNFFDVENGFDDFTILDGNYDSSYVIGQYSGTNNPGVITSSTPDGCLTFVFSTDNTITDFGWQATVTCSAVAGVNDTLCSGTNCSGMCGQWICNDGLYPTSNNGNGVEDLSSNTEGCLTGGEIASQWFYFTALTTGTVEFTFLGPQGQDYNLAVWGPSTNGVPPCPLNTGNAPVLCSQADVQNTGNPVGLSDAIEPNQSYEGPEGDGWIQALDMIAGETYAMILNIFQNGNPQPIINLTIGGTGELDCTPVFLPIELLSFDGINQGDQNLLTWITLSELNNDFFTIERSINGFDWELVDYVKGSGTVQRKTYYSLVDDNPYLPVTYYRLSQTDYDGKKIVHDVIAVNQNKDVDGDLVSVLFPNPTSSYATFTYAEHNSVDPLNVKILDQFGSIVAEYNYLNMHKGMPQTLRTDKLSSGLYQVIFTQGDKRSNQKLSIVR